MSSPSPLSSVAAASSRVMSAWWRNWLAPAARLLLVALIALSFVWPLLVWLLPRVAPPPPPLCWGAALAADPTVLELEAWNADLRPSCRDLARPPVVDRQSAP